MGNDNILDVYNIIIVVITVRRLVRVTAPFYYILYYVTQVLSSSKCVHPDRQSITACTIVANFFLARERARKIWQADRLAYTDRSRRTAAEV